MPSFTEELRSDSTPNAGGIKEEKALYDGLLRNAILLCERSLEDEESAAVRVYIEGAFNILTSMNLPIATGCADCCKHSKRRSVSSRY
jgi:hypothetical protein